jgi:DNA topoisomerase III
MKVVLAEKPSVARELATFLGASARREGYFEGKGYQVTWALGHLATLKEPHDYDPALKKWSLAALPIVPERFGIKPIEQGGARKQLAVVRRLFRDADELISATDAGREGELIFRYIQELVGSTGKPARRLWLSSLTESAIRDAFRRLRPLSDYDNLYAAARSRSEADWVVGLNATRYYTVRHRASGILWSVGRVQTPVLAMIVRRDDEIRTFKPEPFWELLTKYRDVTFKFAGDRFTKEEDAQALLQRVLGRPFTIRGVEKKPERVPPPQLYDLTELQRDMNRRYGMSADATLKVAQSLYEDKLISYPRTDSRYLGQDMKAQIPGILEELRALKPAEIGRLDLTALPFTGRIVNNAKVSDHHAIIPTGKRPGTLSPPAQKVYDAVITRLIAAFYPACVKEVTIVNGTSDDVPFRARGVRVLDPGWTVLYPRKDDDRKDKDKDKEPGKEDDQELPEFRPGETGPHEPFVRRGETTPPKSYTENTLLGAMETAGKLVEEEALKEALKERGLGTPATRAAIIETLLDRGYITRDKKSLAATDLGRYLIAIVQDRALKSPELTGDWEAKLRQVERGQLDRREFMAEIVRYTGDVIRSGDAALVDPGRLGDCPRCGRPVIEGKRGYGCSGWREGCPFVLWREYRGVTLTEDQVRELLQRRVLLRPLTIEGAGDVILQLLDSGVLADVPVPAGVPRKPGERSAQGKDGRTARRAAGRGRAPRARKEKAADPPAADREEAKPRRSRSSSKKEPGQSPAKPEAGFGSVALGACPLCGSEVVEQEKSFGCSGWKQGCKFAIWKTIAGKAIGVRTAQALLKKGRSPLLSGFQSKAGNRFDAYLKLEDGQVRFEFDGADRRRPRPSSDDA